MSAGRRQGKTNRGNRPRLNGIDNTVGCFFLNSLSVPEGWGLSTQKETSDRYVGSFLPNLMRFIALDMFLNSVGMGWLTSALKCHLSLPVNKM